MNACLKIESLQVRGSNRRKAQREKEQTMHQKNLPKSLVLGLIKGYRMTAGLRRWFLPPVCRFHPSCSLYTYQAVELYGTSQGLWMGLKRLVRCHPLHPGGVDPVPLPDPSNSVNQENPL